MSPDSRHPSVLATALVSLGISSSFLLWLAAPLVDPAHTAIYHWSGPPSRLFVPVILDLLVGAALLTLLLRSALNGSRWRRAVWGAILFFTPSIELKNVVYIWGLSPGHALSVALALCALAAWFALVFSPGQRFTRRFEPVVASAQTLFFFIGIGGIVLLAEIGFFAWQARGLDQAARTQPIGAAVKVSFGDAPRRPRVIWIVFDELSFQQVYANRDPGLQLPAFDALAAQSTLFTHTIPAGDHTEYVMPALFSGKDLSSDRSSATGRLLVRDSDEASYAPFNPNDTIFADARDLGYKTDLVGWYNPYCRILPSLLKSCFWTYDERIQTGMYPGASILSNALQPLLFNVSFGLPQRLLARILPMPTVSELDARQHIQDFRRLDQAARAALNDTSANFVLLHLPVPHPGSIFNRATGKITGVEHSYLDNLAITDRCLASIRTQLERSGQWDTSTILIMGDHSWRTWIWRTLPGWTAEDERASRGGQFDARPLYLVKLAGQHEPAFVKQPFPAVDTRLLIDQIFSQQIRTPQQLVEWAERPH